MLGFPYPVLKIWGSPSIMHLLPNKTETVHPCVSWMNTSRWFFFFPFSSLWRMGATNLRTPRHFLRVLNVFGNARNRGCSVLCPVSGARLIICGTPRSQPQVQLCLPRGSACLAGCTLTCVYFYSIAKLVACADVTEAAMLVHACAMESCGLVGRSYSKLRSDCREQCTSKGGGEMCMPGTGFLSHTGFLQNQPFTASRLKTTSSAGHTSITCAFVTLVFHNVATELATYIAFNAIATSKQLL